MNKIVNEMADKLLIEAQKRQDGMMSMIPAMAGHLNITAGDYKVTAKPGKEAAEYKKAFDDLLNAFFITEKGKGIYELTVEGWDYTG